MGVVEKIKEIQEEMARTQKNKATEYHLGLLKAKLARYRAQLLEPTTKSGPAGVGFDVQKAGDARVALIGFPSVGKSTLLSKTTHTASEVASYEFTYAILPPSQIESSYLGASTLTAIPGVIEYEGARIQLLDLPGIVEGAAQGRGRGRQVVSTAKTADLIVMMLDATKSEEQRNLLEIELDAVGIRLNKHKPDIVFKKRTTGGITFTTTVKLTKTDEKTIRTILAGYKLHNCDVMIREDITTDDFIDVLIGTRKYIPCLYVYNKIDAISLEQVDKLARTPNTVVISCEMDLNLDYLIERMWAELNLVKVYTKKRGDHPDLTDPICLRAGATVEDVCNGVHRSLATNFRYGLVWASRCSFYASLAPTHAIHRADRASLHRTHRKSAFLIKCKTTMLYPPVCVSEPPSRAASANRNTHLVRLYLVYPPGDLRALHDKRAGLQELDVVADRLLEVRELKEVDPVDLLRAHMVAGARPLDELLELRTVERDHPAARVVVDRDLARAEQALGDDQAAQRVLPANNEERVMSAAASCAWEGGEGERKNARHAPGVADDMRVALLEAELLERAGAPGESRARRSRGEGRYFIRASMQVTVGSSALVRTSDERNREQDA
ncbi:unnamed protein product [Mycena citricolor]|uniref:OBG-type G domain-containing protein n=1 Tax=Mycena citricolor TaxID=2018698 RepID=A0AAD2GXR6_9AGAR|nr:unnamed protein product [Mycena citricolor]